MSFQFISPASNPERVPASLGSIEYVPRKCCSLSPSMPISKGRSSSKGSIVSTMNTPRFEALAFNRLSPEEMLRRAREYSQELARRRTTRQFSREPVPRELIELSIQSAGTAPSGAHRQPWLFVAIDDPELKRQIREKAEEEEFLNYHGRMPVEWLEALKPLGTDEVKTHLTDAPWLVVLFKQKYEVLSDGKRRRNYYVDESVGIAAGLFIAAIHHMGLVTLTHTPSPMGFLSSLLRRPASEAPILLMPV